MQAEYFVVQEGQSLAEAQASTAIDLRPLWWFSRSLAAIAEAARVTPLDAFVSADRDEMVQELGEEEVGRIEREGWAQDGPISLAAQWFPTDQGHHTVATLLEHIRAHPELLNDHHPGPRHAALVSALEVALEFVATQLAAAQVQGRRFRLVFQL